MNSIFKLSLFLILYGTSFYQVIASENIDAKKSSAPEINMCPDLNNAELNTLYTKGIITKSPTSDNFTYQVDPEFQKNLGTFYGGSFYNLEARAQGHPHPDKKNTCSYEVESTNHSTRRPYKASIEVTYRNQKADYVSSLLLDLTIKEANPTAFYKMIVADIEKDTDSEEDTKKANPLPTNTQEMALIYNAQGFDTSDWKYPVKVYYNKAKEGAPLALKAGSYKNSEESFNVPEDIPIGYDIFLPTGPIKGVMVTAYGGTQKSKINFPYLLDMEKYLLSQNIAVIRLNLVDLIKLEVYQSEMPRDLHNILHASIDHFFQVLKKSPEKISKGLKIPSEIHVCLQGSSFGGRTAIRHAELYPDTFDLYISHDGGLSNLIGGKSDIIEFTGKRVDKDYLVPMEDRDENGVPYDKQPDQKIAKIKQPVLLIHNIDDNNVNVMVSLRFYLTALMSGKGDLFTFYVTESSKSENLFFDKTHYFPTTPGTKAFESYGETLAGFILKGPTKFKAENKLTALETELYADKYYRSADALNIFISQAFTMYTKRNKDHKLMCQKEELENDLKEMIKKNIEVDWQNIYRPIFALMEMKNSFDGTSIPYGPKFMEMFNALQSYITTLHAQGQISDAAISAVLLDRFQQIIDYAYYQLNKKCDSAHLSAETNPEAIRKACQTNALNIYKMFQSQDKDEFSQNKKLIDLYRDELLRQPDFSQFDDSMKYFTSPSPTNLADSEIDKRVRNSLREFRKLTESEVRKSIHIKYNFASDPAIKTQLSKQYHGISKLTDLKFYETYKEILIDLMKRPPNDFLSLSLAVKKDIAKELYQQKYNLLKYLLTTSFQEPPASVKSVLPLLSKEQEEMANKAKEILIEKLVKRALLINKCTPEKLYKSTVAKTMISPSSSGSQLSHWKKNLTRISPIFARKDQEALHAQSAIRQEYEAALQKIEKNPAALESYIALNVSLALLEENRGKVAKRLYDFFNAFKEQNYPHDDFKKILIQLSESFPSSKIRTKEIVQIWEYTEFINTLNQGDEKGALALIQAIEVPYEFVSMLSSPPELNPLIITLKKQWFQAAITIAEKGMELGEAFPHDLIANNLDLIDARDPKGYNALHTAIINKKADVAIGFIDAGADINLQTKNGENLLYLAIEYKLKDVEKKVRSKMLLDALKNDSVERAIKLIRDDIDPYIQDQSGNTPFMLAARKGYIGVIKRLIPFLQDSGSFSVILNLKPPSNPIIIALKNKRFLTAITLLEEGLKANVELPWELLAAHLDLLNQKDSMGNNVLHIAIAHKNSFIALEFIKAGADVTSQNIDGKSPLDLAKEQGLSLVQRAITFKMAYP